LWERFAHLSLSKVQPRLKMTERSDSTLRHSIFDI
jgi:hypothetical protein